MHTHKAYSDCNTAIATQWTSTGMPGITQALESCVANPPGARLVTHGRASQVSGIQAAEPKVPQRPHTTKQDKDRMAIFASPSLHQVPIDVTAGWAASPGHQVPI